VSDKTVDGVSEANHLPAWDSYQGQVPLSHGDGPAIFMLEADHRRLASTGSGADAIKHRAKQRELISQGKFLEAFEMDVADITLKCPDGRYTKAIQQARMYLAKLADEGKLKPIR
jgi:filamentous hemagglutinin